MGLRVRSSARLIALASSLFLALTVGSVLVPPKAAATTVCGHLTGMNVWTAAEGPYYMVCTVEVDQGASLEIQAGVSILVTPGFFGLLVRGAFTVSGTANDPAVFDSNASAPARGDWNGITLYYATSSQITGLIVRHARWGLSAGPFLNTQAFLVRDSEFADNFLGLDYGAPGGPPGYFQGINVHDNGEGIRTNGTISVSSSRIQGNDGIGIEATPLTSYPGVVNVLNSSVSDNGGTGISIRAYLQPPGAYSRSTIACSEIARNGRTPTVPGYGIDVETDAGASVVAVSQNNMVDNAQQARDTGAGAWDDGRVGNFWSNYTGTDGDGDGFGDTPFVIDADSQDHLPFIAPVRGCPGGGTLDQPPGPAAAGDAHLTGVQLPDVTLTWDLSPDDGAGEDDVAAYLLYTSPAFDPRGGGYALLATLPPGTTTYTDVGAGARDPADHFYRLIAKDAAGQTTASGDQFAKYTRTLTAGPHLLSIPVRMSDTRIDTVLQGVDYSVARTYVNPAGQGKNWLTRAKDKPWGDLTAVDEAMALWVLVDRDSDLVVAGLVRASVTIHLTVGWNFVGYPSFVDRTVGEALADANVQTVEGFDPGNAPFYLRRLAPTDVMHAGDGFWVHVSDAFDWALQN